MSAPPKDNICSNCKYFWRYKASLKGVFKPVMTESTSGECWRFPPLPITDGFGGSCGLSRWSHCSVKQDDYCGEFIEIKNKL